MTEDNDLIAAMIESGQGAITGRSRTWLNSQVAQALTTARAEAEALRERADALALQADEWEGKYAAVSEMNAQLRGEVERLGRALREIDRMNDHPKWFRQSVNDIIGYALSKGPTQ